ncbi:MAG: type II 3-dehydroquinate dehydratase [Rhodospirillales bacterium]
MSDTVFILNGPNLNLLGLREPSIYGRATLDDLRRACAGWADDLGLKSDFRQSNNEGDLIDWLQEARSGAEVVILNAAAFTHTSVALRDAVLGAELDVIEVHLSNIHAREPFRHQSHISPVARGIIMGLGARGYRLALMAARDLIDQKRKD